MPKTIKLSPNKWFSLPENHFYHATNGQIASQITVVKVKVANGFLFVEFDCQNNPFVAQNTYTEHNSEMYNQEVFEVFIATGKNTPQKYLELEINPNNALFVGWIENNTGQGPDKLDFVEPKASGIMHGIQKSTESWNGFLTIPLQLVGSESDIYRINFYRIVSKESQIEKNWKCNINNCDFTCWSPTMSGATPAFHKPAAFGNLIVK